MQEILCKKYEDCLDQFGAAAKGVGWSREEDFEKRFSLLLANIKWGDKKVRLLDLGCGYGALVEYLKKHNLWDKVDYLGVDISEKMIKVAQTQFPDANFLVKDILETPFEEKSFDYVVNCGILTSKFGCSHKKMLNFAKKLIIASFKMAKVGVSFNVMNYHVDWRRDDLFHVKYDLIAKFIKENCSRFYAFRADNGLYDYMIYIYREPNL